MKNRTPALCLALGASGLSCRRADARLYQPLPIDDQHRSNLNSRLQRR